LRVLVKATEYRYDSNGNTTRKIKNGTQETVIKGMAFVAKTAKDIQEKGGTDQNVTNANQLSLPLYKGNHKSIKFNIIPLYQQS